jgi:hypothetical protein
MLNRHCLIKEYTSKLNIKNAETPAALLLQFIILVLQTHMGLHYSAYYTGFEIYTSFSMHALLVV